MDNSQKDFNEIYKKEIFPIMDALEPQRQKELEKYNFAKMCCIIIPVAAFILLIVLVTSVSKMTDGLGVLLFAIFFVIFGLPVALFIPYIALTAHTYYKKNAIKNFKKILKDACLPKVLPYFENLKYKDQEIPKGLFEESGLFPSFNIIIKDDIFTGKHQDIWFHIEEVRLRQLSIYTSKFGATSFSGVTIVFPTNKTVKSQTIISSKNDKNINNLQPNIIPTFVMMIGIILFFLFPIMVTKEFDGRIILYVILFTAALIYLIYDTIRKSKKYEGVKLEDIGFDKRFAVYSKDQIEARYLVTPAFMERLYKLQTAFGTKNIKCSFFGNKIMIAISTDKDIFEIGDLFTPLTNSGHIHQFVDELTSVYDMIDYFKLNEKTGL